MALRVAWISVWCAGVLCIGCASDDDAQAGDGSIREHDAEANDGDAGAEPDAAVDEQREGDPVRGRALLLNNGTEDAPYLSCGVPRSILDGLKDAGFDPFVQLLSRPVQHKYAALLGGSAAIELALPVADRLARQVVDFQRADNPP